MSQVRKSPAAVASSKLGKAIALIFSCPTSPVKRGPHRHHDCPMPDREQMRLGALSQIGLGDWNREVCALAATARETAAAVRVLILAQRPCLRNCAIHPLGSQLHQVLPKRVELRKLGRYQTEHLGVIRLVVWVVLYPHFDNAISLLVYPSQGNLVCECVCLLQFFNYHYCP